MRVSVVVDAVPNGVPFMDTNIRRVLHRVFFGPDVAEPEAAVGTPYLHLRESLSA